MALKYAVFEGVMELYWPACMVNYAVRLPLRMKLALDLDNVTNVRSIFVESY